MNTKTSTQSSKQSQPTLPLKGRLFTLTVLQLHSTDLAQFTQQLKATVEKSPSFFQHAPFVIDIHALNQTGSTQSEFLDLPKIIAQLRENEIIPIGVRGGNDEQQAQALTAGLAVFPGEKEHPQSTDELAYTTTVAGQEAYTIGTTTYVKSKKSSTNSQQTNAEAASTRQADETVVIEEKTSLEPSSQSSSTAPTTQGIRQQTLPPQTKLITQPIRSGQQIYARGGDLIVTASVSHGAELLADGNIHVYGTLRGRALAGINGNKNARIFCKRMEAQLVSIAGQYLVNETQTATETDGFTQIYLENDHLRVGEI